MGALTDRIRKELTEAMKARDALRTSTLRMLQAAIKNEQIERGHELADDEAQAVILRAAKQRNDSIEQYEKGGRTELADKEREELKILETYLPRQLDDAQTEQLVREAITATGATSKKDAGMVMKEIMANHRGEVDGKKVQQIVQRLLA